MRALEPLGHARLTDHFPPRITAAFGSYSLVCYSSEIFGGGSGKKMWLAQIDRWSEPTQRVLPGRLRMILRF